MGSALAGGMLLGCVQLPTALPAGAVTPTLPWGATTAQPCDPLDTTQCMAPFPNDFYTVADAATSTGRRITFPPGSFPAAVGGQAFDPTPWEGNDGFSPGSTILTHVPGLDLARSHVATLSDIGSSLARNSPVVLLDARTGQRWATWSELDVTDHDPATQFLIVHPARNLTEGDRFIVVLRHLKTGTNGTIPPGPAFASVLAGGRTAGSLSPAYASHLHGDLDTLARSGVSSRGLYLAWDFTVASESNLTRPALTMRNQTFASLGNGVGPYLVTKVTENPPGQPKLARIVTGYFDVPSYLSGQGGAATSVLTESADGQPQHEAGHTDVANFECEIPRAATAAKPASIGVYGHGLFNAADEVTQSSVPGFANAYDYVFCGTDWLGLSSSTLALGTSVVTDFNHFPALVDNLLQALLNAQVLGNLLVNPKGFARSPAFEDSARHPLIRPSAGLAYYGNSEGGIMGGAFTAVSTEVHRSVLGVPGMDYALLLPRSADFAPFQSLANKAYPDRALQEVGVDLLQMLWDRADADGYAQQMTGGLPGTPHHQVLLEEAFGDHQVANVTTETEARTIGAHIHQPALAPGRSLQRSPFWGLSSLGAGSGGPALFVWDTGVPPAPQSDTPPTAGRDPHDTTPRSFPSFWRQMATFLRTGVVTDPCGASPCRGPMPPAGS
jgi:hypothetical protein